jgi:Intracellular proteinase inhibitor
MRMPLLLLLMTACTIERRGAPGTEPGTELEMGPGTGGDSVVVEIVAPRYAAVGDTVPINVVVHNNRLREIDLNLTGRELAFDIVVARSDSTIVWQRLRNVVIQPIVQLKTLMPGESFTLTDRWHAAEAGSFVIGAELPTDSQPLQAKPVSLTIR